MSLRVEQFVVKKIAESPKISFEFFAVFCGRLLRCAWAVNFWSPSCEPRHGSPVAGETVPTIGTMTFRHRRRSPLKAAGLSPYIQPLAAGVTL